MRFSLYLLPFLFLNFTLINGMSMTGEGIETRHGSIKWAQLVALPAHAHENQQHITLLEQQLKQLRMICLLGAVIGTGAFIYLKWFNNPQPQASASDDMSDLELISQQ